MKNGWRSKLTTYFQAEIPASKTSHTTYGKRATHQFKQGSRFSNFDTTLFWLILAILIWGIVMVYSASIAIVSNARSADLGQAFFLVRDVLAIGIGLILAAIAYQIKIEVWEKYAPWLFILSLVFLIAVLIPHVGRGVNGSHRWIGMGAINFQPSEFAKLTILFYASNYMVRKMSVKESFLRAVLPMGIALGVVGILLLAEPDLGAFMVISVIAMGIIFIGGVSIRMMLIFGAVLGGTTVIMVFFNSWRRARILAYLDPWSADNALGKGYQLSHSLIAFGRGELFGVGLGRSIEKLNWLPEAHTDFLMAVIGEELGFVGVILLLILFLWLIRRVMNIGRQAIALDSLFAGLFAQGVAIWLGFQTFFNVGVNLGLVPTKGLTLPMMSYGGSAVVMNLIALAIVLRIDSDNRRMMRKTNS